jgi:probable HAF family extracellular repeat protein
MKTTSTLNCLCWVGFARLLTFAAAPAFCATQYNITDLGSFLYESCDHTTINNFGQEVGYFRTSTGWDHACLWPDVNHVMPVIDLGTLGGRESSAFSINNLSQIVGWAQTVYGWGYDHAFLYQNGTMTDLGTFGGNLSYAYSINDLGQIVGTANPATPYSPYVFTHAFLYQNGTMTDLNTLIPADLGWELLTGLCIQATGQILCAAYHNGADAYCRLDPILLRISVRPTANQPTGKSKWRPGEHFLLTGTGFYSSACYPPAVQIQLVTMA